MRRVTRGRQAETGLAAVRRLGRHLPLLGVLLGVPAVSAGALSLANVVTQGLLADGGHDATAVLMTRLNDVAVAWVKLSVWAEQAVAYCLGA